jgi:hypothetical protein
MSLRNWIAGPGAPPRKKGLHFSYARADEAPGVHDISDGLGSVATDMGRRLTRFTL